MRGKHLLMASALLAFMASCNDNAFDQTLNEGVEQTEGVTGKLIAAGGSIELQNSADSRLNFQGWEAADNLGLAWINNTSGQITTDQTGKLANTGITDDLIYANHKFMFSNGDAKAATWNTNSNVYEGAHFAYYPHAYASKVQAMTVKLDNTQTSDDYKADVLSKAFQIGPRKYLKAADVKDGELAFQTPLYNVTNHVVFTINPSENMNKEAVLAKQLITGVTFTATNAFAESYALQPQKIAAMLFDTKTGAPTDKNAENFDTAVELFDLEGNSFKPADATVPFYNPTKVSSITTTVDNENTTVAATRRVFMNLLPANVTANPKSSFKVTTKYGYFTFSDAKTATSLTAMNAFLAGTSTAKVNEINEGGAPIKFDFTLSEKNYTANYVINTMEEWKEAVEVANALKRIDAKKFGEAKFKINTKGITFSEPEMLTNNEVAITVTAGTINIDGAVNYPKNLTIAKDVKVNVLPEAVLTIGDELKLGKDKGNAAKVTNYGKIIVGVDAYVHAVTNSGVYDKENYTGEIEVVNGSHVEVVKDFEGIVSFKVANDTKAATINTMISDGKGFENFQASANTLVVPEGVTLDLCLADGDYYKPNTVKLNVDRMKQTTIRLEGGSLVSSKSVDAENTSFNAMEVAKIIVKSGATNVVKDVKIGTKGEFSVEEGAAVTVDATSIQAKKGTMINNKKLEKDETVKPILSLQALNNNGSMTFNASAKFVNFVNNQNVTVAKQFAVRASTKYAQNGTSTGDLAQGSLTDTWTIFVPEAK